MNFITGEKFQELADISIALNTENNFASDLVKIQLNNSNIKCYVFDPNNVFTTIPDTIKYANSIFVYTHILPFFFEKIFPLIENSFTLITHNSDCGVDKQMLPYLESSKIKKWYCQNKYFDHPKLFSLPIAIANKQWPHGNLQDLEEVIKLNLPKTTLIYKNFNISTNFSHRYQVNQETNENGFEMALATSFKDYIKQIKQSYFCIAPLGNGADCHRIWECLYLNCVPIVPKKEFCFDEFKHLPILFVDSYKDITKEFLYQQIDNFFPFDKYNFEILNLNFWKEKITL
jgi:hypothetical protein